MPDWLLVALGIVTIAWTLLPMIRHEAWWIRAFEFPRVQITVLTIAVLVLYLWTAGAGEWYDIALVSALVLCILFQLARIARYTALYPEQLEAATSGGGENELRLLVANVLTPNRNASALLDIIENCNPDIVLTVETDGWWQSELDVLEKDYPHTVRHPLDNLYGMHLYSRRELRDTSVRFLVEDDVPSIHGTVILRSGHSVALHCLHPAPPSPTENESSAERDAELLIVARDLADSHRSAIVMGDLNDVAWSYSTRLFQKLSGLLDPRIGRGMYSTFHARYPFLRWPLDHIFCSPDFRLLALERLPYFGSDHFPIFAVLQHSREAARHHDIPTADRADAKRAEKKIDKVDANEEAP